MAEDARAVTNPAPNLHAGQGSTPIPDPTLLTTQQLTREIATLREILEAKIDGQGQLFTARFVENEKAVQLHQAIFDRIPSQIDEKVLQSRQLSEARFERVDTQIKERDVSVREAAITTKETVAQALTAAKELVGQQNQNFSQSIEKSDATRGEQISQLRVQIDTVSKGFEGQFGDIKERVTRIESVNVGRLSEVGERRSGSADTRGNLTLIISGCLALLGVLSFVLAQGRV